MSEPKRYELETMADLFKIPLSRFDDFMVDLKEWRKLGKQTTNMLNSFAKALGEPPVKAGIKMHWIDDGKHDKKIIIATTPSQEDKV
jgi:hypothetical protein